MAVQIVIPQLGRFPLGVLDRKMGNAVVYACTVLMTKLYWSVCVFRPDIDFLCALFLFLPGLLSSSTNLNPNIATGVLSYGDA